MNYYFQDFNAYIIQYMNKPIVLHHLHEYTNICIYIHVHSSHIQLDVDTCTIHIQLVYMYGHALRTQNKYTL